MVVGKVSSFLRKGPGRQDDEFEKKISQSAPLLTAGGGGEGLSPHGDAEDDTDKCSIVSMGSDSTSGPFFWYRVVSRFSPKPRNCQTATMMGDEMIVFGGFGGSKWYNELVCFNTHDIEWHIPELEAKSLAPPPRYAHSAVSFRGLLYIFGGYGGDDNWLGDLWALDAQRIRARDQGKATVTWFKPDTTGTPPTPRAAHTANIVGKKLFVWGGNNGTCRMNDLYSLDTQTLSWKKEACTGAIPSPRAGHSMNVIPAESTSEDSNPMLLLFAGGDITDVYNDLHTLDTETLVWRPCRAAGPPPSPRAGHCTTVLPDGVLLVWGGGSVDRVMNDLHLLDPRTMSWSGSVDMGKMVPEPRVGHTIACKGSEVYVFGGGDSVTVFGDLIILDTDALSSHWAGRKNVDVSEPHTLSRAWRDENCDVSESRVLARAVMVPPNTSDKNQAPKVALLDETGNAAGAGVDKVQMDAMSWDESSEEEGPHNSSVAGHAGKRVHRAVMMDERYRELAHKLNNRPSKEALMHLNILKGSSSVTPSIQAAQQRLQMRKTGSALEMKLHRRPKMDQLVLHNIIPEEDEYVEHEIRLWGHVPGVVHPRPGDINVGGHRARGTCSTTNGSTNGSSKVEVSANRDVSLMQRGLSQLEQTIIDRISSVRMCLDGFKQPSQQNTALLVDAVRNELNLAQSSIMQQVSILQALAMRAPPPAAPPNPPRSCASTGSKAGVKKASPALVSATPPEPPIRTGAKRNGKGGLKRADERGEEDAQQDASAKRGVTRQEKQGNDGDELKASEARSGDVNSAQIHTKKDQDVLSVEGSRGKVGPSAVLEHGGLAHQRGADDTGKKGVLCADEGADRIQVDVQQADGAQGDCGGLNVDRGQGLGGKKAEKGRAASGHEDVRQGEAAVGEGQKAEGAAELVGRRFDELLKSAGARAGEHVTHSTGEVKEAARRDDAEAAAELLKESSFTASGTRKSSVHETSSASVSVESGSAGTGKEGRAVRMRRKRGKKKKGEKKTCAVGSIEEGTRIKTISDDECEEESKGVGIEYLGVRDIQKRFGGRVNYSGGRVENVPVGAGKPDSENRAEKFPGGGGIDFGGRVNDMLEREGLEWAGRPLTQGRLKRLSISSKPASFGQRSPDGGSVNGSFGGSDMELEQCATDCADFLHL